MLPTRETHNTFTNIFIRNFDGKKVDIFKELKEKEICQTRNPYPSKLSLQYWRGNKDFSRKAKAEGDYYKYIGLTRKGMLEEILQAEIDANK